MSFYSGIFSWLLLGIIIILYVLWVYYRKKRIMIFCENQNGPTPYPFIGNILLFHKNNILQVMDFLKEKYSLPTNLWIFQDYHYITDRPEEVKIILSNTTKSFDKSCIYNDLFQVLMGSTFIMTPSSQVKQWKFERRIVQKSFSSSLWQTYVPVFNRSVDKIIPTLKHAKDFKEVLRLLSFASFEIFLENFMDISDINNNELIDRLFELQDRLMKRSVIGRLVPYWFFKNFMEEGKKITFLMDYFKSRIEELIQQKREQFLKDKDYIYSTGKQTLIETLLCDKEALFSNEDVYRQMLLISLTSIETTALTLIYTLAQLGMNPEIQEKVHQEIKRELGNKEDIDKDDLSKLKYLEQAIYEAIRIFTVIPFIGRHVTQDLNLGSNKILPKGSNVLIPPYFVHRNDKYWPDPEKYDPDRFSNKTAIQPGSYIPFLIGPRDCIGRYYSLAQAKIMAAKILAQYEVKVEARTAKELKFEVYIVMRSGINFEMKFVERVKTA